MVRNPCRKGCSREGPVYNKGTGQVHPSPLRERQSTRCPPFHGPRQALVGKGISIANPRPAQALYTRKDSGTYPTRSMDGSRKVPHLPPWAYGLGISPPQG